MRRWVPNLLVPSALLIVQSALAAPASKWAELKAPPGSALPDGRTGATAIYDPLRNVMVLYGGLKIRSVNGAEEFDYKSDVWTQSFGKKSEWTERVTNGAPLGRSQPISIYDSHRDRMVIFGGSRNGAPLNDVWALSLENFTWSTVEATGDAPSPRDLATAIYDEARDRMIIFGGAREIEGGLLSFDEVWVLQFGTTNTWQRLDISGVGPGPRTLHAAFYVAAQDWMVVTGGFIYGTPQNDVWALTLGLNPAWVQIYPNNEGPDAPHWLRNGGCFDPIRNQIVCFGTCCPFTSSVWGFSIDKQTWQDLTPKSAGPSPRAGVPQIFDPVLNRMVIFGGTDGFSNYFNDSWALKWQDFASPARKVLTPVESNSTVRPVSLEVFPNPVRGQARIVYGLSRPQWMNLSVYDLQGRRVATLQNGEQEPGEHEAAWGTSDMKGRPSGMYFVRLLTEGGVLAKRFLVVP